MSIAGGDGHFSSSAIRELKLRDSAVHGNISRTVEKICSIAQGEYENLQPGRVALLALSMCQLHPPD